MNPEDPKLSHEVARAIAEIGARRKAHPVDLLVESLFALCPIADRQGYDVLGYAALATRIYLRYRELLAQAGAPAAAPAGKEPPQ